MKFRDIYSDIVNYLDLQTDYKLYHNDIVFSINDAIRELRFEFLKTADVGDNFTVRESIDSFTQSTEYPYLKEATLTAQPIKDFQISKAYFNANCYLTSYEIQDSVVTLAKDTLGVKGNYTYILTEAVTDDNTFNKIYDPFKVRPYYKNNGIKYKVGDYIKDVKNNKVYKVTSAFTANFDTELEATGYVEKMVWKKITNAYFSVVFYPLQRVNELRYFDNIEYSHAFSVRNDKIFVTPNVAKLFIEYVPEWTNVTDLEAEINLPDILIPNIKRIAINALATKLGMTERATSNE